MTIQIHDSLSRRVQPFETREEGKAAIYCCGPTVYNYIHVGNARTFVWFDLIRRYLTYRGYDVTFVMNYTDVDDKIIDRARIEGISPDEVTRKYSEAFEKDLAALGAAAPDYVPRATQHIEGMIEAIGVLVDKGFAYPAEGNVWFSVESFPGYGKLSGRTLEDMRAGERVEPHPGKRHPLDFSLWKAAKEGEPSWDSPWGPGRPGWHIECSVMSDKLLGMGFDIHGGGSDLMFPHHENEIAQSEALTGTEPFARYWLHAGMVQMETEKMSKSLGNVVLAHEVLDRYPSDAVRYWMLQATYRSQVSFSASALDDAVQSLDRWKTFADSVRHALGEMPEPVAKKRVAIGDATGPGATFIDGFIGAMDDDFNSAVAFASVHDLVRHGNKLLTDVAGDPAVREELRSVASAFAELTDVLGFAFPEETGGSDLVAGLLDYLLERRERARERKDFDEADEIRKRLTELGVTIEDTPSGARWRLGDV